MKALFLFPYFSILRCLFVRTVIHTYINFEQIILHSYNRYEAN